MYAKSVTLVLIISLLLSSCCKEEEQPISLPEITTTGEGSFACLINEEVFVRSDCGPYVEDFKPHYSPDGGCFTIFVYNDHHFDNQISIYLSVDDYYGEIGVVELSSDYHKRPIADWKIDTLKPHYLEFLRFDTINKIASGTFEFTIINPKDSLDIWEIKDGRFDMPNMNLK